MVSFDDALNALRIDKGDNDEVLMSLFNAIPGYIEEQTGMSAEQQESEPLVTPATYLILGMWYDWNYDQNAVKALNSLLKAISLKVVP